MTAEVSTTNDQTKTVDTMIDHILFDFFGTLVEYSASRTEQGYGRSHALLKSFGSGLDYSRFLDLWSKVSEEFDKRANEDQSEFSMHEVSECFLERAITIAPSAEMVDAFVNSYIEEWNKGVRYPDGINELLERLGSRYKLGIVTNTHLAALVEEHLEKMGVASHFKVIVTSIGERRRKPHPQIFLRALELLDTSPARTLFVGDSYEADYLGARQVSIECFLIDASGRASVPAANRLGSLHELEEKLGEPTSSR
ncbi:MAG: HAD family hydrolase [Candidatus Binataceae bacterium]